MNFDDAVSRQSRESAAVRAAHDRKQAAAEAQEKARYAAFRKAADASRTEYDTYMDEMLKYLRKKGIKPSRAYRSTVPNIFTLGIKHFQYNLTPVSGFFVSLTPASKSQHGSYSASAILPSGRLWSATPRQVLAGSASHGLTTELKEIDPFGERSPTQLAGTWKFAGYTATYPAGSKPYSIEKGGVWNRELSRWDTHPISFTMEEMVANFAAAIVENHRNGIRRPPDQ